MAKKNNAKAFVVAAIRGLNFREKPDGHIKAVLPDGEVVKVIEHGEVWSKIRVNKATGYVMTQYLQEVGNDA